MTSKVSLGAARPAVHVDGDRATSKKLKPKFAYRKEMDGTEIQYDTICLGIVDQIVWSNGRRLTTEETEQLCTEVKTAKFFDHAFKQVLNAAVPDKSKPETHRKINGFVYQALLDLERCPWDVKKYLFTRIPTDCKDIKVYHSYIFAADKVNDFETINRMFEEVKVKKLVDFRTYSIFIKTVSRQGYIEEARKAFLEAKEADKLDSSVYLSFLNTLGRNSNFDEVQALFDEASNQGFASLSLCNSYMHIAGKHRKYAQARAIFLELRNNWKADKVSYTTFMNAAGITHEFEDVQEAYYEALENNLYDEKTLNSYIDISGKNGRYDEALKAFQQAKNLNKLSNLTFCNFILAAARNKHFREAKDAFLEAKKLYPLDVDIIDSFIKAAGENKEFEEAKAVFEEAKRNKLPKTSTFEMFIVVAGINKKLPEAKAAFELALTKNYAGPSTYTRYIDAAANCGDFSECKKAFKELKLNRKADSISISRYIQAAGQAGDFNEVEESYSLAMDNSFVDTNLLYDYIEAAGMNGKFSAAQKAFNFAIEKKLATVFTHNIYLNAAGINGRFREACLIYDEMCKRKTANTITYNVMIKISGFNGDYKAAKKAFQEAKLNKFAESGTYSIFIEVAGGFHEMEDVRSAYKESLELNCRDYLVYNCYIFAEGSHNGLSAMQEAYDEARARKKADSFTYCTYIDKIGNKGSLKKAQEAFLEARGLGYCETALFNCYMDILRNNGKIEEANLIFEELKKLGLADARSYNSHLNCNPENFQAVLEEAKSNKALGAELFNSIIAIEGKKGNYNAAKNAYLEARKYRVSNAVTYTNYIDVIGKLNRFEEAADAFQDAVKSGLKDVNVYNSFMHIAAKFKKLKLVDELFEEVKKLQIADAISYTIYIIAVSKAGNYVEAKKAFADVTKFKIYDAILYKIYLNEAGRADDIVEVKRVFEEAKRLEIAEPALYSKYISLAGKVAKKLSLQNQPTLPTTLPFIEAKKVYLEAEALGLINKDIFEQFINAAGCCQEFEEANKALKLMEEKGFANGLARNVLQNWKIQKALSLETSINIEKRLPKNSHDPLYRLLSISYRFSLKIKSKRQVTQIQTEEPKAIPLPLRLTKQIDEEVPFVLKTGAETAPIKIRSLLKGFAEEAEIKKVSILHARLAGGAANWCEEEPLYKDSLVRSTGNLDPEYNNLFIQLMSERFPNQPKDWDFKFLINSSDPEKISDFSDGLIHKLAAFTLMKPKDIREVFFHKQSFINKEGNIYSIRRLVDSNGVAYEIIVGGMYARPNLFYADALQYPLDRLIFKNSKKSNAPLTTVGSVDQARLQYLFKRLEAEEPETINEYGCSTYITKRAQGYYCNDPKLESHVCQVFAALAPEESIKMLLHARENHSENTSEHGITLLYHVCTILFEGGYIQEIEELIAASEPLWNPISHEPFFKELTTLWLKEKAPFMEIKAAIEMILLLNIITSQASPKLDEHNGKPVIGWEVHGCYFSAPLSPSNTLIAFSMSSKKLERLIFASAPENGFSFDPEFSNKAAQFLGISPPHLELLKTYGKLELKESPPLEQPREVLQTVEIDEPPSRYYGSFLWNWAYKWMRIEKK